MTQKLRELMLMRHAKSDWKDNSLEDYDRPLANKGKKAACKLAAWLPENNLLPDLVWVSPAKRAQQTLKRLNLPKNIPVETLESLYLATQDQLLSILKTVPKNTNRILLIGHNPGLERLFEYLTQPNTETEQSHLFPTATLAHLVLPASWETLQKGEGKLIHFIRPKDIPINDS